MRGFCVAVASAAVMAAGATASVLTPPVLPLVVRNPYLSLWLADARNPPWSKWPMFYEGQEIGLSVMAAVQDTENVYPLLGRPQDSLGQHGDDDGYKVSYPIYLGANYDASTTNFSYSIPAPKHLGSDAKAAEITLSFLSPITPTSTLRQSIPGSYLSVQVQAGFDVDVYIDLNGQWVSGDRGNRINWELVGLGNEKGKDVVKSWRIRRETEQLLTEFHDQSEWGTLHFSGPTGARYECGTSALLRQRFARTGTLQNEIDNSFRGIMEEEPVFAFAKTFKANSSSDGTTRGSADSAIFSFNLIQDPVVQFASERGLTYMRPYWSNTFSLDEVIVFHYLDYQTAWKLASNYSAQLEIDANKSGSQDYVDIVALSARQVMGATVFSGTPESPLLFLKEISSNGNMQTIDVIYPAFPFFLYTNPRWLAYLLEPLIEHMLSGQYPNDYAMHDLGTHYPNATGHADGRDEYMPVEECGNILIMGMALVNSLIYEDGGISDSIWSTAGSSAYEENDAHSAFPLLELETRDGVWGLDDKWGGAESNKGRRQAKKYVERSYKLWKQWTGYLIDFTLTPENQLSTDDFAGWLANQTNLAIKGIIGIKAMAGISEAVEDREGAKHYNTIADRYVAKWEEYGISRDETHAKLAYTWFGSWTTLYNIFADALLCFRVPKSQSGVTPSLLGDQKPIKPDDPKDHRQFVSDRVYQMQSDWYSAVRQRYGLPLDSRHLYTKSDWEFFAAAVASRKVRSEILDSVALWINETTTDRPFTDLYETEGTGHFPGLAFKARPVVGGHFSFLALERACDGKAADSLAFLDETKEVVAEEGEGEWDYSGGEL